MRAAQRHRDAFRTQGTHKCDALQQQRMQCAASLQALRSSAERTAEAAQGAHRAIRPAAASTAPPRSLFARHAPGHPAAAPAARVPVRLRAQPDSPGTREARAAPAQHAGAQSAKPRPEPPVTRTRPQRLRGQCALRGECTCLPLAAAGTARLRAPRGCAGRALRRPWPPALPAQPRQSARAP
jgi:hypothetical protein